MEVESDYDDLAQAQEDRNKLVKILVKKEAKPHPSAANNSKVKLPYEMLINKLVDSLETPEMFLKK